MLDETTERVKEDAEQGRPGSRKPRRADAKASATRAAAERPVARKAAKEPTPAPVVAKRGRSAAPKAPASTPTKRRSASGGTRPTGKRKEAAAPKKRSAPARKAAPKKAAPKKAAPKKAAPKKAAPKKAARSKADARSARGKRGRIVAPTPPPVMKVREIDPQVLCGRRTTVEQLFRVDEIAHNGNRTVHLVFLDRHGWYCEHGTTCPAVREVMKLGRRLLRAS